MAHLRMQCLSRTSPPPPPAPPLAPSGMGGALAAAHTSLSRQFAGSNLDTVTKGRNAEDGGWVRLSSAPFAIPRSPRNPHPGSPMPSLSPPLTPSRRPPPVTSLESVLASYDPPSAFIGGTFRWRHTRARGGARGARKRAEVPRYPGAQL